MADFNIVVDTNPMVASVSAVSQHVTATTAAVVAMQTAVIASEKASADKICANVDKGFFDLIRSQISMKLSVCYTEMQAKLSLLMEYSKTLGKTQERMEGDLNRVKGQYRHIFKGLDKSLSNRIAQLDREAVGISETRKKVILGMFERHVPETVIASAEVDTADQRLAASRIKDKTDRSLDHLGNKVSENTVFKTLTESMMDAGTETRQEEYIPVVYSSKQSSVMADNYVFTLHYPEYLPEQIKNSISLNILNKEELFDSARKEDFERKTISDEFRALVAASSLDPRVTEQMMKLFMLGGC